jgi:hypothetical protein
MIVIGTEICPDQVIRGAVVTAKEAMMVSGTFWWENALGNGELGHSTL